MTRIALTTLDVAFYLTSPKFKYRNLDVSNTVVYLAYEVCDHSRRWWSGREILGDSRKTT